MNIENSEPKVLTVVVPTYNAEKYLRDNLESFLIESIMDSLEILIINDGSTDHSLDIAMEYVRQYPDVFRVITKANGGHGSGINYGIKYANGKYFKVVDSDDWVDSAAFEKLMKSLRESDSDIVYSGFYWVFDEGQGDKALFQKKAEIKEAFDGVNYGKEYCFDKVSNRLYIKMHSMTIRTELLRKIHSNIDEHCYYVDTEYITYPIPFVKTIRFIDAFVYMYRIGRTGQSVSIEKMQHNAKSYDIVLSSLLSFYSRLENDIPCTYEKKMYIASIISRVIAAKIKLMLSFPPSSAQKKKLKDFDQELRIYYPDIYKKNIQPAVKLLRLSNYALYYPASIMVRKKY